MLTNMVLNKVMSTKVMMTKVTMTMVMLTKVMTTEFTSTWSLLAASSPPSPFIFLKLRGVPGTEAEGSPRLG